MLDTNCYLKQLVYIQILKLDLWQRRYLIPSVTKSIGCSIPTLMAVKQLVLAPQMAANHQY